MNGPAAQKFQRELSAIYNTDYNKLRSLFTANAKAAGIKLSTLIPDMKKETLRRFAFTRLSAIYKRDALAEVQTARQAPMILNTIFEQNTTQIQNGQLYVNVPAITRQVIERVPQFAGPTLSDRFKEWIKINRINFPIPANRMLFLMRRNVEAGGREMVLWSAWMYPNREFLISESNQGRFYWLDYVAGISQNMGYVEPPYYLTVTLVEPKRENPGFIRVGYNMHMLAGEKNCLVRILEPFAPRDTTERFIEMTKDLIHTNDTPAYINPQFIDQIAKLLRVKISLYTPYGALKDIPTQVLGSGGNKKNFKVIVKDQHAYTFAPSVVNKVNYITDAAEYIEAAGKPNISTIIEEAKPYVLHNIKGTPFQYYAFVGDEETSNKNVCGYITVDGFGTEANTTMHKFLRPSAITGLASDDTNYELYNKTNPASIFLYNFIRKNKFTTPPQFVHDLAAKAGRPFGTAYFKTTTQNTRLVEIDQNASYASFEFSPFYQGLPMGNWMKIAGGPKRLPDPALRPAFMEVESITVRSTGDYNVDLVRFNYVESLGRLRSDFSVITYPEYLRWSEICDIAVINTTYATFERVSLYDDINEITARMEQACVPTDPNLNSIACYIKQMRNSFTGKLIQGGLDTYGALKTLTTTSKDEFEIMVGEHERDFGEMPTTEIITNSFGSTTYKIITSVNKPGHRFPHVYAYITAISRLSVLEKIAQLKAANITPVRVHVDAIYVRQPNKTSPDAFKQRIRDNIHDIGTKPGMFKCESVYKRYEQKEITESSFDNLTGQLVGIMSQSVPAEEGYPGHRKVAVVGPGGCGKSTVAVNFLRDGNGRALYLVPTRELRSEMRDKLDGVNKPPSDCICLESVRRAITVVDDCIERGRSPPPEYIARLEEIKSKYTHIIIDEFCKTDGKDLQVVINFANECRKNIIMMGDPNQTVFSLSGVYATDEKLDEWGFIKFKDPRNARAINKPMRHDYTWGTFLDTIAGKTAIEQVEALRGYGVRVVSEDTELDGAGIIYCGSWTTIARYNGALIINDRVQRIRRIGKKATMPYAPEHKTKIWNKSGFTEKAPRGALYSVDFAQTVDSVQGSTVENTLQYIHVASLVNRWGAIYTACTRSRLPEHVVLVI